MKSRIKGHYERLKAEFGLEADVPMAAHTSFRVGGPADLFAMPTSIDTLTRLVRLAGEADVPMTIMGSGTNLLVGDRGIRGLVVAITKLRGELDIRKIDENKSVVTAFSGTILASLFNQTMAMGLNGLSFAAGIPGTLGGAVMMNAGTNLGAMSDVVSSLDLVTRKGKMVSVPGSQLEFSNKELSFSLVKGLKREKPIIIKVALNLKPGEPETIKKTWDDLLYKRKASQPVHAASAGCFFKNPNAKRPAGLLIDKAGLKGRRVGNAMVSKTHANFIVNLGGATAGDILTLKRIVEQTVLDLFSVTLETEVRIEGE